MINKALRLTLVFFTFLIVSCNKNKKAQDTTINGQVRTYGTEEAMKHPPVLVQIVKKELSSTWGSGPAYPVQAETWTDSSGNFSLSASLYPLEDYFLAVEQSTVKDRYHYIAPTYSGYDMDERKIKSIGGHIQMNYYLRAIGWVRFHFINTDHSIQDEFWYNVGGGGQEVFYGPMNVYRAWSFSANLNHDIALIKIKDGIRTTWQIPFIPVPFDTIDIEVKF